MCTPRRRSRSAVAGPTPGMTVTCIGRSRSCSIPGATTTRPSGLSRSLAILAMSLEVPMPTDPEMPPVDLVHPVLEVTSQGADRGDGVVREVGGLEVDERLVQRQRLDQGADRAQQLHHREAGVAVGVEPAGEERGVRAAPAGLRGGHRRVHPERARLVGRGRHHAPAADPADDDRLAAQRGLVALLHRGEEGIEIHVQDRRLGAHAVIVPRSTDTPRRSTTGCRPQPASHLGCTQAGSWSLGAAVDGSEGDRHDHTCRARPHRPVQNRATGRPSSPATRPT